MAKPVGAGVPVGELAVVTAPAEPVAPALVVVVVAAVVSVPVPVPVLEVAREAAAVPLTPNATQTTRTTSTTPSSRFNREKRNSPVTPGKPPTPFVAVPVTCAVAALATPLAFGTAAFPVPISMTLLVVERKFVCAREIWLLARS